jgi:hypothetical protein
MEEAEGEHEEGAGLSGACTGFFLGLHFEPEDGGNMLHRNVLFFHNYKTLQPTASVV